MDVRTDRLGLLLDQFDTSAEMGRDRLHGLTDEEFLWEPAPGAWSIRQGAAGRWELQVERPPPDPTPLTTIAWRLAHLQQGFAERWEWTFGAYRDPVVELAPTAAEGVERLWAELARWRQSLGGLTEEQMDTVGFGRFPHGFDPTLPFIAIVWWTNRELIHHLAEAALLRDLWPSTPSRSG
ncbi:MAG TPA: DinB family protein [Acidimicrobiales bacterium]|nr:DinB family protein [Acidimicrobiales bacterium]